MEAAAAPQQGVGRPCISLIHFFTREMLQEEMHGCQSEGHVWLHPGLH
jgi:hypothetical protein